MWKRRPANKLTPREREVLGLLRRGLTNDEIAQRLDISVAGAKYHVSAILSKLGVETREEAAAMSFYERRRWWASWPLWARIAGAGTVVAATAAFVLAVVSGVLNLGGQEEFVGEPVTALEQHNQCDWSQYEKPGDVSLDVFESCGVDFLFPNTLGDSCAWEVIKDYAVAFSWPLETRNCNDPWGVLPEGQTASITITQGYGCGGEWIGPNGESLPMDSIHPAECDERFPHIPPPDP